jgi:hypothetical protein
MRPSDPSASPSRREPVLLPECLTRLLDPQGLDAGYIVHPIGSAFGGPKKKPTYARALASIWLDLDRLDELINGMVNADRHA